MPKSITNYSLLISCPGDIEEEISIIKDKVADFNRVFGEINNVKIETKHWSKDSFPQSGGKPQELLNKQFVKDCDLAVAVFWTRFGTPTDKYGSGTEEEIELLINSGKQVFLYFSDIPKKPTEVNPEQYSKIKEFRKKYADKGLYSQYGLIGDFEKLFLNHLNLYFLNLINNSKEISITQGAKLKLAQACLPQKYDDSIEFYKSSYIDSEYMNNLRDEISKLIELINSIRLPKNKEETEGNIDNGGEKPNNGFLAVGQALSNAVKVYADTMDTVYKKEKIIITEEVINTISTYAKKNNFELANDFFDIGSLSRVLDNKFSIASYYGSNKKSEVQGTDDEKKKYNAITDLEDSIYKWEVYYEYISKLDVLYYADIMISNVGNKFDEDIDVEIKVNKNSICKISDLPIPDGYVVHELSSSKIIELFYKLKEKRFAEEFSSGESYVPPNIPFIPDIDMLTRGKSYDKIKEEFKNDLDDAYIDYKWYEEEEEDIIQLKAGYLKSDKNMLFPTRLFFKEIPKYLKYKINSKHQTKTTEGELRIMAETDL